MLLPAIPTLVVALVLLAAISTFFRWKRSKHGLSHLPGLDAMFLVGNLDKLIGFPRIRGYLGVNVRFFQSLCGFSALWRKEGMCSIWVSLHHYLFVFSGKTCEAILNNSTTIDKSFDYEFLHPWLGTGLLTSNGKKWKSRRRLLTPSFHFRILDEFIPVMNEQARVFVSRLKEESRKGPVDVVRLSSLCTLDIICETAMGVKMNAQTESNSAYIMALDTVAAILIYRILSPWLWSDFFFRMSSTGRKFHEKIGVMHDFTKNVIKQRKLLALEKRKDKLSGTSDELIENGIGVKKRKAFLDLLIDVHLDEKTLTEDDIREEVDTFMFEGHDTTSMGINWAMFMLGHHPEVQQKAYLELQEILGDDKNRDITTADLASMKYLECVIKESQRLYPSVPMVGRHIKEDIKIDGQIVRKGTYLFIWVFMLHRDPQVFPNPEAFNPENFMPENVSGRNPYAYVPFSAGPRNCIGQRFAMNEEKVVLAHIIRNFVIQSLEHRDKILLSSELILKPKNGLLIKLEERK